MTAVYNRSKNGPPLNNLPQCCIKRRRGIPMSRKKVSQPSTQPEVGEISRSTPPDNTGVIFVEDECEDIVVPYFDSDPVGPQDKLLAEIFLPVKARYLGRKLFDEPYHLSGRPTASWLYSGWVAKRVWYVKPDELYQDKVFVLETYEIVARAQTRSDSTGDPHAQVIARAIAAFQYNNQQRVEKGCNFLTPCIAMDDKRPTFHLVLTLALSTALSGVETVRMEDLKYRKLAFERFLAFENLARSHWKAILEGSADVWSNQGYNARCVS
ncbi:hypothetical protein C8F04DRAFT_1273486 [Mycena alexandri]|uniref:Uncharacterized protein n=1 Tax=Mycena alexandri TaxID=1745969 RepID=A0AAD6S5K2_9AGAR|nr:hypothetical protein C8F04DRAFT_1273486 [Mycena alexandri]